MKGNIYQNCTYHLINQLLNTVYASIVRDCCSAHDIEKLEKLQLSAARIVTGFPIFTSRESLSTETGWQTLQNRRYTA